MRERQQDSPYITLGKITAHYGVKGWLKLFSHTEPRENILSYRELYLFSKTPEKNPDAKVCGKITLLDGRVQGKTIIAQLAGCNSREDAEPFIGSIIAIKKEDLRELSAGEYYWIDLIGLTVINQQKITLGKVQEMIPTGANDVLVVKNKSSTMAGKADNNIKAEYLIPYIPGQYILNIDLNKEIIQVDWDSDF